jgi:transcriptional regulator with XRE-family HTH domain
MQEEKYKRGRPLMKTTLSPWPELFKYEHGQSKLAKRLGVSQTTVCKWAQGIHRIPELARRELLRLCKKHGIKNGVKLFESS